VGAAAEGFAFGLCRLKETAGFAALPGALPLMAEGWTRPGTGLVACGLRSRKELWSLVPVRWLTHGLEVTRGVG
jgi:hypothetical protein